MLFWSNTKQLIWKTKHLQQWCHCRFLQYEHWLLATVNYLQYNTRWSSEIWKYASRRQNTRGLILMFHLHARNEMLCCSASQRSRERKKSIFLAYIKKKKINFQTWKYYPQQSAFMPKNTPTSNSGLRLNTRGLIIYFYGGTLPPPPPLLYFFYKSSTVAFVSLSRLCKTYCNVTSYHIPLLILLATEEIWAR